MRYPWSRPAAQADVTAPDGRRYLVEVAPVVWPAPESNAREAIDSALPEFVSIPLAVVVHIVTWRRRAGWGVRVFRARNTFRSRPLMFAEEFRDFDDCLSRAREIAEALSSTGVA